MKTAVQVFAAFLLLPRKAEAKPLASFTNKRDYAPWLEEEN